MTNDSRATIRASMTMPPGFLLPAKATFELAQTRAAAKRSIDPRARTWLRSIGQWGRALTSRTREAAALLATAMRCRSRRESLDRRMKVCIELLETRDVPASGIPSTFVQRGPGGGGALFSPALSPHGNDNLFIASDMSQLFRSADAGNTWTTLDFRQIQGGHASGVQFTDNPSLVYAIDYSTFSDGSSVQRPMKSLDGGTNWFPLASDPTGGEAYRLYVDPANSNRIVVSSYTSLYFSTNGGASFSQRYTNASGLHLGGALFEGSAIYIGSSSGLLFSTNGGTSFSVSAATGIPATESILSFAGARQGAITRFVAVTAPSGDVYPGVQTFDLGTSQKVYTLDLGGSWTLKMNGIAAGVIPIFAGMANNNVNVAYIAGGGGPIDSPTVYKSTDGGNTWAAAFNTTSNQNIATGWQGAGGDRQWSYGEIAMGFAVQSNDANRAIITDYGFGHLTTDGGAQWRQLYVNPLDQNAPGANIVRGRYYRDSGLDNTTAWQVTWADANNLIVSNSDINASVSNNAGQSFGFDFTGHSRNSMYRSIVHPVSGTIYAATASVHDLYQSTYLTDARIDGGNGAVLFSNNSGHTWQTLHDFGKPVVWVAADPTNANRLYAAVVHSTVGGIYVTNNLNAGAGSTWVKLTNPPRTQGHAFNVVVLNDGTLIATYSGRRAGSPLAFTNSSGVFASTDGGATWIDRSAPGMLYWTKDLVVDPHDATQNTWYAGVFSGWGGPPNDLGGLYKTTNRGQSWTRVFAALGVTSMTFNPTDLNEAWVTTETTGLFYSNNIRSGTPTFAQVAGYPFRQPERVFYNPFNPNEIWVTSFGNGIRVGVLTSNQPPVNQVPGAQTKIEGTALVFSAANGNAVAISDPDAGAAIVQTAVSASGGTVTLSTMSGLTIMAGANGTATIVVRGAIAAINAALNGMSFASAFNQAAASIQIVTDDLGNTGGSPMTDTDTIAIAVDLLPKVAGVFVRGSAWSSAFLNHLAGNGAGNSTFGFALTTGVQQATSLPWINLDRLSIAFTEPVVAAQAALALRGVTIANYPTAGFSYDAAARVATWSFTTPLLVDRLRIDLSAAGVSAVRDLAGNALDGWWVDGSSSFVSGNSSAGTNFQFRFNMLPGGATRAMSVLNADLNAIRNALFSTPGAVGYSIFVDLDGSGTVVNADLNAVRNRLFDALPPGTPNQPNGTAARRRTAATFRAAPIDALLTNF